MSRPREGWWSYAKWVTRMYPDRVRELGELRLSGSGERPVGKASKISRPTENLALRELPGPRMREYEAVRHALEELQLRSFPDLRRELIRLVYWQRSHTLSGAAMQLHISYETAKRWQQDFLRVVARGLRLAD